MYLHLYMIIDLHIILNKWIEDLNVEEDVIIESIKFLISKHEEARVFYQSYRDGDFVDNLSLLHIAAKYCRPLVCEFLIKDISISNNNLKYFEFEKHLMSFAKFRQRYSN